MLLLLLVISFTIIIIHILNDFTIEAGLIRRTNCGLQRDWEKRATSFCWEAGMEPYCAVRNHKEHIACCVWATPGSFVTINSISWPWEPSPSPCHILKCFLDFAILKLTKMQTGAWIYSASCRDIKTIVSSHHIHSNPWHLKYDLFVVLQWLCCSSFIGSYVRTISPSKSSQIM